MCRCAVTRIEKEEMLQLLRKDDEQRDDTPIPTYTRTFEPAVPACGGTFKVVEMLQHSGVQKRQSSQDILLLTWHPLQELSPM
ncbi:hypothetical protein GQ457_04G022590 [Hibiscus cannabinus]